MVIIDNPFAEAVPTDATPPDATPPDATPTEDHHDGTSLARRGSNSKSREKW